MITVALIIGAILLILFGISRLKTHHWEGILEILVGILEIISEILMALV
jgi:hypothetical protein